MQETGVWSLGGEDSLEKGMATCSGILAWRIPWTEASGGLQSMGLQRAGQDWTSNIFTFSRFILSWWAVSLSRSWQNSIMMYVSLISSLRHFLMFQRMIFFSSFGSFKGCGPVCTYLERLQEETGALWPSLLSLIFPVPHSPAGDSSPLPSPSPSPLNFFGYGNFPPTDIETAIE